MSGPNLTIITGDHYYVPQRWLKTITDEEKPFEIKSEDTIHLSPTDYAVYEAYKNSVDKRR